MIQCNICGKYIDERSFRERTVNGRTYWLCASCAALYSDEELEEMDEENT